MEDKLIANIGELFSEIKLLAENTTSSVEPTAIEKRFHISQHQGANYSNPSPNLEQQGVESEDTIVTSVLNGHSVCLFGHGKTGTPERGFNRTLKELFKISEDRKKKKYEFYVSIMEVHNERIKDLLAEESELSQRVDGTKVPRLVAAKVYTAEEVWSLVKTGNQARSVGSTTASSRSHCLLRLTVKGEDTDNGGNRTNSNLWVLELAENEAEGERVKQSEFIDQSMSSLGVVIAALELEDSRAPYSCIGKGEDLKRGSDPTESIKESADQEGNHGKVEPEPTKAPPQRRRPWKSVKEASPKGSNKRRTLRRPK